MYINITPMSSHKPNYTSKPDRTCPICNKAFNYPWQLRRHQRSSRKCKSNDSSEPSFKCEKCERVFTRKYSKERHVSLGRCKDQEDELPPSSPDRAEQEIAELKAQNAIIQAELASLKQMIKTQASYTSVNNTQIIHTNIVIQSFGQEDLSHIEAGAIRQALECGGGVHDILGRILRIIYHDNPSNRNVYLPNKNRDDIRVYEAGGWVHATLMDVVPQMTILGVDAIFDRQTELEGQTPEAADQSKAILKELARDCPVQGGPTSELVNGLKTPVRSILICNRPTKKYNTLKLI